MTNWATQLTNRLTRAKVAQTPLEILGYDPEPGVVSFVCHACGYQTDLDECDTLEDWRESIIAIVKHLQDARDELALRCKLTFIRDHDLTADEFNDPVNQVLFRIQYPEARS